MSDAATWKPRTCKVEVTETEVAVLDMLRYHGDLVQFVPAKVRGGAWIVALLTDGFYWSERLVEEQVLYASAVTGLPVIEFTAELGPVCPDRGHLCGRQPVNPESLCDAELRAALRAADGATEPKP